MKSQNIQTLLLSIIALAVIFIFVDTKISFSSSNRSAIEHSRDAELHYWKAVSDLNDEVQSYINSKSPTSNLHAYNLIESCWKYGIDLKFVLAQAQVESNFGTAGLAAKTNSVWNVGAYDTMTYDQIKGRYKYNHPNSSIEPYLKLLSDKYLVGKSESDLMKEFVDVSGRRYATEPQYEQRLRRIYTEISENTNIDQLLSNVRHYKIESGR